MLSAKTISLLLVLREILCGNRNHTLCDLGAADGYEMNTLNFKVLHYLSEHLVLKIDGTVVEYQNVNDFLENMAKFLCNETFVSHIYKSLENIRCVDDLMELIQSFENIFTIILSFIIIVTALSSSTGRLYLLYL